MTYYYAGTPQELQHIMLRELSDESRQMGLKMNIAKTNVMVVDNTPINVNNVLMENVIDLNILIYVLSSESCSAFLSTRDSSWGKLCWKLQTSLSLAAAGRVQVHCKSLYLSTDLSVLDISNTQVLVLGTKY